MNLNFYIPTRMITGKGCVRAEYARLAKLGDACLVVTGRASAQKCGALADAIAALEQGNVRYEIYSGIQPNPTLASCMEAAAQARAMNASFILGIGGGSPLDAAKAIAVLAANPMDQEALYGLKWPNAPLPVAAIGTTAGTGSEVTPVSVLTTPDGRKRSFRTDSMYPAVSFGDPTYTAALPDAFTRSTAVDAVAHAMESYFNRTANAASRAFAAQALRLLAPALRKIAATGTESLTFDDREALYNGSIFAGMAISITGTAFPHAMGYFLSEQYGIPHGTACAVYLPAFLRHNRACADCMDAFCAETGLTDAEWIDLLEAVTPPCTVTVSPEARQALASRWVNNRSINKSLGTVTPEYADALIAKLFSR